MKKVNLIILLFIFITYISFTSADIETDLDNNAIYYYKLEESNIDYTDEVGNDDLTIASSPNTGTGIINTGQDFEGSNNEYLSMSPSLNNELDYPVISFWFKPESNSIQYLIDNARGKGWAIYQQGDGTIGFQAEDSSGNRDRWLTSTSMNTGTWYHIFAYYDGSDSYVCINGASDGSQSVNEHDGTIYYDGSTRFTIGSRWRANDAYETTYDTDGIIDEVYYGNFGNIANCTGHANFIYNSGSPTSDQQYPFSSISGNNFTIAINSPANNTYSQTPTLIINYTVTDRTNTNINCSIFANSQNYNITNVTVNTSLIQTLDVNNILSGDGVLSFYMNCTNGTLSKQTGTYNYIYDTTAPDLNLNFHTIETGFNDTTWATLQCNDTLSPTIEYNLTLNSNLLNNSNQTNNTLLNQSLTIVNGNNNLYGSCIDLAGNKANELAVQEAYKRTVIIIDEVTGGLFDYTNVTNLKLFFEEFNNTYDFKAETTNEVTLVANNSEPFRVDIEYSDGSVISRYINLKLIDNNTRICANEEGITHQTQYITSGTNKPAILKSLYADCYVSAGYTNLAYQDFLMLPAYTIDRLYYLYTYSDDEVVYLASVDGSIGTDINLASLEFSQTAYNFNIVSGVIDFENLDNDTMKIVYRNTNQDSIRTEIDITRLDTSALVFTTTELIQPNNITIYFDYSTLSGVNESTLFKIEVEKTTESETTLIKKYFNINGKTGLIPNGLGVTIAIFLTLFGLTIGIARLTFSWFGVLIQIGSIVLLSLCLGTWVVNLLIFTNVIILVYIFIILYTENYQTVA